MTTKELASLGVPLGEAMNKAAELCGLLRLRAVPAERLADEISAVVENPKAFERDGLRGPFALALQKPHARLRKEPIHYRRWGADLDSQSIEQMDRACLLPISTGGALMPDAHVGYGLPIGGVLATEGAVIPYGVGVDIACRMKLTVLDAPLKWLDTKEYRLIEAIEDETRFGVGAFFKQRRNHEVMDEDWTVSPITEQFKDKAWSQLGTSGSGNHFVEFGVFTPANNELGLEPRAYLALLSHSGSRGTGAAVCNHYSRRARELHPDLPKELQHLAWLDLDSADGQEYWAAMNLMGDYAAANHACIHREIARNLGAAVLLDIENHHNFAWREVHHGREMIVHRKGATPAGPGVLGIIPGSMASPGFVVRGKGNPESLNSASHGAGRLMSRTQAVKSLSWKEAHRVLDAAGVKLLSAGLDEVPMVYKNIHEVMAAQSDLVDVLGRFDPKLVKMCPGGERAED